MSYGVVALGDQGEDMEAINRYVMTTPIVNQDAVKVRDNWLRWYDDLSWYEKNYEQATYDHARNLRNEFSLANTRTAAEREQVKNVMKTGMTTEEMQGGTRRTTSEGTYIEKEQPLVSTTTKVLVAVAVIGGGYLYFTVGRPLLKAYRRARS